MPIVLGEFVYLRGYMGGERLELMRLPLAGGGMEVLPEDQPNPASASRVNRISPV